MQVMFDRERPPAPADAYPAVWLQLEVKNLGHLPAFAAAIRPVILHARTFPGMVRFGFDIDWRRATFRTFGAFDTEASLRAYVDDGAHGVIYRRLRGRLGEMRANYGTVAATELPTTWADVRAECFTEMQRPQRGMGCHTGHPGAPMSP